MRLLDWEEVSVLVTVELQVEEELAVTQLHDGDLVPLLRAAPAGRACRPRPPRPRTL